MKPTDDKSQIRVDLRDVARLQPGYLSRTQVRHSPTGTHKLLQARDVSPQYGLQTGTAIRFLPERNADLYRIIRGDILLAARGQDHHAYLVDFDPVNVLASSVFYIVRAREHQVVPGYLAWYLNQPDMQTALAAASRGTAIGYIPRSSMAKLSIMVPPMAIQYRIAETINLWSRLQKLQACLDLSRERLIHSVCRRTARLEKE